MDSRDLRAARAAQWLAWLCFVHAALGMVITPNIPYQVLSAFLMIVWALTIWYINTARGTSR